jgi:hypothetical protein
MEYSAKLFQLGVAVSAVRSLVRGGAVVKLMGKVRAPSMRKTLSDPMRTSTARSDDGNIRRRTASQKFIIG